MNETLKRFLIIDAVMLIVLLAAIIGISGHAVPVYADTKAVAAGNLEDYIAAEMDEYTTRIDISGFHLTFAGKSQDAVKQKAYKAMTDAINNNPRLFFVGNTLKIGYTSDRITSVYPEYTMKPSEANKAKAAFDAAVNKALSKVNDSMSTVQKAKIIHDYIALNAEYDIANYNKGTVPIHSFRAYGVMVKKIGVCQSYALAYKYIMEEKLGIECGYASTQTHIWNVLNVNEKYYNVDITWDDGGKSKVYTTYFLAGSKKMASSHKGDKINYDYITATSDYGAAGPAKVTLKSVKAGTKTATVTWGKASATGYNVYMSTKKSSGFAKVATVKGAAKTSYTKKGLKKGKTYFFKVQAYKTANGKTAYGPFSAVKSVKIVK